MRLILAFTLAFLIVAVATTQGSYQILTNIDGIKIRARILKKNDDTVFIERDDDKEFTLPISKLSAASRRTIDEWQAFDFTFRITESSTITDGASGDGTISTIVKIECSNGEKLTLPVSSIKAEARALYEARRRIKNLETETVPIKFITDLSPVWSLERGKEKWILSRRSLDPFVSTRLVISETSYLYWADYLESFDLNEKVAERKRLQTIANK